MLFVRLPKCGLFGRQPRSGFSDTNLSEGAQTTGVPDVDGFKVYIEELETASNKIFAASDTADSVSPGSIKAEKSVTGHEGLSKAFTAFGETWDFARKELQSRATKFGETLRITALQYERHDAYQAERHERTGGR